MVASRLSGNPDWGSAFKQHIYGLDLIRLLAAVGVGVFHLTWRYKPLSGYPPIGWVGVQIFFVLSGFVIAASARGVSPATFVYRRFMRLYPAAWICTLISLALIVRSDAIGALVGANYKSDPYEIMASLTLYGNGFLVSAFWTLQIELAFYALIAVALAVKRVPDLSLIAKALIAWNALYIAAYLAWQLGLIDTPWLELDYGKRNVSLLRHGSYFALGIFLALPGGVPRRLYPWIALAVMSAVLEITFRAAEVAEKSTSDAATSAIVVLAVGIWAVFCLAIIASIRVNHRLTPSRRVAIWVRSAGLASYPFYLLHESVGGTVMGALVVAGSPPEAALWIGLAATAIASYVVAECGEPGLRWLIRSAFRPRTIAARAPSTSRIAEHGER